MLLFQASPIYPPSEPRRIVHCPELNDFVATHSDCLLHVQCDSDNSAIAQGICDLLKTSAAKSPRKILYFQFNSRDNRFNNISAMIATLIAQLAYASLGSLTQHNATSLNRLLAHRAWNPRDLYYCWESFQPTTARSDLVYVLSDFDQCDESRLWFLEQLNSDMRSRENCFKIIIVNTTRANKNISLATPEFPVDAYREISVVSSILLEPIASVGTNFEVAMLLQKRPQYIVCESRIQTLIGTCTPDFSLCRVVIQWLRSTKELLDTIEASLDDMTPPTPATVFMTILKLVPREWQNWARILISWVLSTVRPLRVEEFCVVSKLALGLKEKSRNEPTSRLSNLQSDLDIIHSRLLGIFTVIHDEVHFSHPCLHILLESGPHQSGPIREWYQGENNSQRHLDILEICLAFLTLPTIPSPTEILPSSDSIEMPAMTLKRRSEHHQLPYAVEYWARHYKLFKAEREDSVDVIEEGISKLLRDQLTRQSWQKMYDKLANPFLRPSEKFLTPLSVVAHFGLDDLVEGFQAEFSQESSLALVEAARNGHFATVRHILQSDKLSLTFHNAYLPQALMAAMSTGAGDTIGAILKYFHEEKGKDIEYPWLSKILCRAAYLGQEEAVKAILGLGVEVDATNDEHGKTPLYIAASVQHRATAKVLLDAHASLTVRTTNNGYTPLHVAIYSQDVTRLLLEYGAELEVKSTYNITPLQLACIWGRYPAAEVLLDHKRFQEYHDPGELSEDQPLLCAVNEGNVKTVDSLLRHDADPNVRDKYGTSLYHAVTKRRIDICRLLLAKNVDVNYVVRGSHPALIEAVRVGDVDIVNLLLDHNADVERTGDAGSR